MGVVRDRQFEEVPVDPLVKDNRPVPGHVILQRPGGIGGAILGAVVHRDNLVQWPDAVHHHDHVAVLAALADIDINRLETDRGIVADERQQGGRLRPGQGAFKTGQLQVDQPVAFRHEIVHNVEDRSAGVIDLRALVPQFLRNEVTNRDFLEHLAGVKRDRQAVDREVILPLDRLLGGGRQVHDGLTGDAAVAPQQDGLGLPVLVHNEGSLRETDGSVVIVEPAVNPCQPQALLAVERLKFTGHNDPKVVLHHGVQNRAVGPAAEVDGGVQLAVRGQAQDPVVRLAVEPGEQPAEDNRTIRLDAQRQNFAVGPVLTVGQRNGGIRLKGGVHAAVAVQPKNPPVRQAAPVHLVRGLETAGHQNLPVLEHLDPVDPAGRGVDLRQGVGEGPVE